MLTVTAVNKSNLEPTSGYNVVVCINETVIWSGQVTGHDRAKGFPDLLRRIANTVAAEGTPLPSCGNVCPECTCRCEKAPKHSEGDYRGIAGLCWCNACEQWWVAGESTLLSKRVAGTKHIGYCKQLEETR